MNTKKTILIYLIFIVVIFSIIFYFYIKSQKTQLVLDQNVEENFNIGLDEFEILNIINGDNGKKTLYDYSFSPKKDYVIVTAVDPRGYFVSYSLIDVKNKTDLFDSYTVYGQGELNSKNHFWTDDNKLIMTSEFNAEGGEGFPGILVVNLNTQTFYRLVDMTDVCPHISVSNCTSGYDFEIKKVSDKYLTYVINFDANSIFQDPSFSYSKEETILLK